MADFNYKTIQNRIDSLYDTKWLQPNACYPTTLFYTKSNTSENDLTVDQFLRFHTNNSKTTGSLQGNGTSITIVGNSKNAPKNLEEYMGYVEELNKSGEKASDFILSCFSKIGGLKTPKLPLEKSDGMLKNTASENKGSNLTLEFLCDRDLKVLKYLQAWQARWYVYDYQKRSLLDKEKTGKQGGQGFLSLANCSIDVNGNITVVSHISVFGLIPIQLNIPEEFGPQSKAGDLPKISMQCAYSNAVLVYPHSKDKLAYMHFA